MTKLVTKTTKINGLTLISREQATDKRGYFDRLFCLDTLVSDFGTRKIIQVNHSFTETKGTVRGLHYQKPPSAELKIITCLTTMNDAHCDGFAAKAVHILIAAACIGPLRRLLCSRRCQLAARQAPLPAGTYCLLLTVAAGQASLIMPGMAPIQQKRQIPPK